MDHLPINRGFKSHVGFLEGSQSYYWVGDGPPCPAVPRAVHFLSPTAGLGWRGRCRSPLTACPVRQGCAKAGQGCNASATAPGHDMWHDTHPGGPTHPGSMQTGGGGCLCSNSASFKLGKAPVRAVCEPRMGHGLCVAGTDIVGEIFYSANFYTTTAVGIIKTHAEEQVTTRAAPRRVKLRSLPGCLPSCPPALCLSLSSPLARNNISLLGPVSLRAQAGSPLFLYLPYQNVHSPNQEPGPFSPPAALPPTPTAGPPPPCHHAHFETDSTLVAIPRVASSALLCATEELPLPPCDSLLALPLFAPQHRGRPTPTPHGRPAAGRSLRCRSTQTCSICSTLGSATSRQP